MNIAKILAVVIVSVSVVYGIYQVASEPGVNVQANSPAVTDNKPPFGGEMGSELK